MNRTDYQPGMLTPTEQQRIARDINPDGWFAHEQIERCAKAVTLQHLAEQLLPEIKRRVERNQQQQDAARKTVYGSAPAGMITRSYSREEQARRFIAEQQANLARSNREIAELRRQVQRERVGYR